MRTSPTFSPSTAAAAAVPALAALCQALAPRSRARIPVELPVRAVGACPPPPLRSGSRRRYFLPLERVGECDPAAQELELLPALDLWLIQDEPRSVIPGEFPGPLGGRRRLLREGHDTADLRAASEQMPSLRVRGRARFRSNFSARRRPTQRRLGCSGRRYTCSPGGRW